MLFFSYAVSGGQCEVVKFLLEKPEVDVNKQGGDSWTAAHSSAKCENLEILEL